MLFPAADCMHAVLGFRKCICPQSSASSAVNGLKELAIRGRAPRLRQAQHFSHGGKDAAKRGGSLALAGSTNCRRPRTKLLTRECAHNLWASDANVY